MRTEEPITAQQLRDAEPKLLQKVGVVWTRGWQPRELVRLFRRSAADIRLVALAISADHAARSPSTLDPRWTAQIEAMDLPEVAPGPGWLAAWHREGHLDDNTFHLALLSLLLTLDVAAPMPVLIPPPGARPGDAPIVNLTIKTNDPMLNRVRALLAQAESTNFEAEAETFTAKAQELMTRHAIDMAMIVDASQ